MATEYMRLTYIAPVLRTMQVPGLIHDERHIGESITWPLLGRLV